MLSTVLTWAGAATSAQEPVRQPAEVRYPIILSSRWFHPSSPQDTLSTLAMVDQYHPDRIDWMYCTNDAQLAQLRARKIPYSLALNPQVPDSAEYTIRGRIQDVNGNKLVAPWMRNWNQKNAHWGCVNAPEFREVFYAKSRKLLDLGAYGLFVDDARFNDHAVEWGGCFCDYCVKAFAESLRTSGADTLAADFNFRDFLRSRGIESVTGRKTAMPFGAAFSAFQTASVVRFLTAWRAEMEAYARRRVTFLTNNYGGQWTDIYRVFDVGIGELPEDHANREYVRSRVATAENLGKKQYFTLTSGDETKQLRALFLAYSAGSALVIPWDVYVNAQSKQMPRRFFAKIQTFSPTYGLFRAQSPMPNQDLLKRSRRDARQVSEWPIAPETPDDSIDLYPYQTDCRQLVLVQARTIRKTHAISIQTPDDSTRVEVVYPPQSGAVRIRRSEHQVKIQYPDDVLILCKSNK